MNQNRLDILNLLTSEIVSKMSFLATEQRYPGGDPDKSDYDSKDAETTIIELRLIRRKLEEIFTGAILS